MEISRFRQSNGTYIYIYIFRALCTIVPKTFPVFITHLVTEWASEQMLSARTFLGARWVGVVVCGARISLVRHFKPFLIGLLSACKRTKRQNIRFYVVGVRSHRYIVLRESRRAPADMDFWLPVEVSTYCQLARCGQIPFFQQNIIFLLINSFNEQQTNVLILLFDAIYLMKCSLQSLLSACSIFTFPLKASNYGYIVEM